ncbi:hypothetical protein DFH28DRAFT_1089981 [Melampsora americana]|nr:hypothetical protein DFH28DRAFT_1089981 [Melampsora americana]
MVPFTACNSARVRTSSFKMLLWTCIIFSFKTWATPTPIPAMLADLGTEAARGSQFGSLGRATLNDVPLGRISTQIENGFKPSDSGAHISEIRFSADVPKQHLVKSAEIIGDGHTKAVKSFYKPTPESYKFPETSDAISRASDDSDSEDVFFDALSDFKPETLPLEQSHKGSVAVKVSTRPDGKVIPDGRSPEGYTRNGIRVTIDGGQFQKGGTLSAKSIASMEKKMAKKIGGPKLKKEYLRTMIREKIDSRPPPTVTQVVKDDIPLSKTIVGTNNNEIKGFKAQLTAKMTKLTEKLKTMYTKILQFFEFRNPNSTPPPPKVHQMEDLKEIKVPEIDPKSIKNSHSLDPETMKRLEQDAGGIAAIEKGSLPPSNFMTELWIDTLKLKLRIGERYFEKRLVNMFLKRKSNGS